MVVDLNSRYGLSPTHSEVVEACKIIEPCDALDMGCSNGRNAVHLGQLGFNVTAIDANPGAINMLQSIIDEEKMNNIKAQAYDINNANLGEDYGFISCTVTLMFMDPTRVDNILADMQKRTLAGGYNLIVCAMSTEEHPCPVGFPFTLKTDQLRETYEGWELIKYNEDVGTMHNGAKLQFATILARKPF
ncbi:MULTISPECIES: tellurite resistance methyltransferase TehB [Colwellia]|uniref:Tellurite resistance protein TehB n=1 Tax=Colwellia psychrerythraea (strain 34H / ATCC BAA-681) TaxID=167879 RepID=Q481D6_COLP3|nr:MULTISPECIES: tellurite resistance methyltransferase TehB [Colwellia]AAZ28788.1 tellurite resistance protein TehB [Colwellia psychrerythraea 34H]PKH87599.1 tellurite resistance methyltransferase TehB [Colwellia sp. Bg11-28]